MDIQLKQILQYTICQYKLKLHNFRWSQKETPNTKKTELKVL